MLVSNGTQLLLDCGTNTLLELRRHSALVDIDAIVISHCHSDHILDLVAYRYALVYSPENVSAPIPLWLPPGGVEILEELGRIHGSHGEQFDDFWSDVFDLRTYDPHEAIVIADLRVSFARTQHFTECYAIRVDEPSGRTIVYGADTGRIDGLIEFSRGVNLLIAEATANTHDGVALDERGHLIPEDAGAWASEAGVGRLLVTHLWHERPAEEVVRRVAEHYDGQIDVAERGQTLYV